MVKYYDMKNNLVCFIVSFFYTFNMEGQVYVPFPDSNAIWQVEYGGYQCSCCASYNYSFDGDTLIGSHVYHRIHKRGLKYLEIQGLCTTIPAQLIDEYIGAIRNDNSQKKVFIVPSDSTTEYILYDFNLGVGDTVDSWLNQSSFSSPWLHVVVDSIDSVLVANQYRKRFNLLVIDGGFLPVKIIEGIGSTSEPFIGPLYEFEWGGYISCFKQNGQVLFPDTSSLCLLTDVSMMGITNSNMKIYPNPFVSAITIIIQNPQPIQSNIEILNILGQTVYTETVIYEKAKNTRIIDLSFLPAGIYILNRITESNKISQIIFKE